MRWTPNVTCRLLKHSTEDETKPWLYFMKTNAARKAFNKDAGIREECRKNIETILASLESGSLEPSYSVYASLLRDCGSCRALEEGIRIHHHIISSSGGSSYSEDRFLLNLIVQMYTQCGSLAAARQVFDSIPQQNLYSYNIMFSGYALHGHLNQAKELFDRMPQKNIVSWNGMITAFVQNKHLSDAKSLFDGMQERDVVSWNALLSGYAQNGHLQQARALFQEMPEKNTISWNSIVSAHAQTGEGYYALKLFRDMDMEGFRPDRVSVGAVISACAWLGALAEGRSIHAAIEPTGLASEPMVLTGLINLYGKCGEIQEAVNLFTSMPVKNMVGWTAMITAYGHNGRILEARRIFDEMSIRVAATWNAMLSAYALNGQQVEALRLFSCMDVEGVKPNSITIINVLEACLNSSSLKLVHDSITSTEFADDDNVRTGLMNMYAKRGSLELASGLFNGMKHPSLVAWNAILTAYTQTGHSMEAIEFFHRMLLEAQEPDTISYISVLSACSHAGLLHDGLNYFLSLQEDFGIVPELGLYGCMVDLLARSGWLEWSEELIHTMPAKPDVVVWISLIGGCKLFGDFKRALRAAEKAYDADPENPSPYLLLSNMCGDARFKEEAVLAMDMIESFKPVFRKTSRQLKPSLGVKV